jgi:chromosome segregation ATPase
MSRILLVIGLPSPKASAKPELVYLGRSGDEMRAAIAAATQPRLIIVPHVQGIPKNNSRAGVNTAALLAEVEAANAAAVQEPDLVATIEHLSGQKDELQKLLSLAEGSYQAANARAEQLANELAQLKQQLVAPASAPVDPAAPAADVAASDAPPRKRK